MTILFPHAGGSAYSLRQVARSIKQAAVFGVDYPGHGRRTSQPFATSISSLAGALAAEISAQAGDRPIVLMGHSLGGLVAFESGVSLENTGAVVDSLFVSSCAAPGYAAHREPLGRLADSDLLKWLVRSGGVDQALTQDADFVEFALPIIRADVQMYDAYRSQADAALCAPVLCIGATDDTSASLSQLGDWCKCTTAQCSVVVVSGGHHYVLRHPETVGELVDRRIFSALLGHARAPNERGCATWSTTARDYQLDGRRKAYRRTASSAQSPAPGGRSGDGTPSGALRSGPRVR